MDTIFSTLFDLSSSRFISSKFPRAAGQVRPFKIKRADQADHRQSANKLIDERYAWRGYRNTSLPEAQSTDRITLSATQADVILGTITVGLDGQEGLHAENTFSDEISQLRARSLKLCEFTKLAVDTAAKGSRWVLASLFHVAYVLAHRVKGCDTLVIETNPRHQAYYKRMLGFERLAGERMHPRVGAPAVLLGLPLSYARQQIDKFGGRPDAIAQERSLYPCFFNAEEEAAIFRQLKKAEASFQLPTRGVEHKSLFLDASPLP